MTQHVRVGQGSYGIVYKGNANTVVKQCDKFDKTRDVAYRTLELTTVTEVAVLGLHGLKHTPELKQFESTKKDKILITMDDGGRTLLDAAELLSSSERIKHFRKFAFQLIEACLFLQDNGIIHNDIKSSNVLVNKSNNLTLIDFGLSAFETVCWSNSNLKSVGTMMSKDFGTYTICPPETFVYDTWIVDKYMPWSIGITLCEFLFKTHSFIRDVVLDDKEKQFYTSHYTNDWAIKYHLGQIFKKRMLNDKLVDFGKYVDMPADIRCLLDMMLCLNPDKRMSLKDLYNLPVFATFRDNSVPPSASFFGLIPELHCGIIEKPLYTRANAHEYKDTRLRVVDYIFDVYLNINKMHLLTHAVHLFDLYCSIKSIAIEDFEVVGFVCAYLAQYVDKKNATQINVFLETFHWISVQKVSMATINHIMEDILFKCSYWIYTVPFDVQIARNSREVDMIYVHDILRDTVPPYNNRLLIKKYVDKQHMETQS